MIANYTNDYDIKHITELTLNDINKLKQLVADLNRDDQERLYYDIVAFVALNLVSNDDRTSEVIRIAADAGKARRMWRGRQVV